MTSLGGFCFARWNKMYSPNENKTNALRRCWEIFFEGKSSRCSHGGRITTMLLDRLTKGQQSPRKSIFSGDKFASFSPKPLVRKFSDEVKLRISFLLESTVLVYDGRTRRWICLQQEGPYRTWSFRGSFQRTSQKGDLHLHFGESKKKIDMNFFFVFLSYVRVLIHSQDYCFEVFEGLLRWNDMDNQQSYQGYIYSAFKLIGKLTYM